MADIFVSYARKADSSELNSPVLTFVKELTALYENTVGDTLEIFIDRDIKVGAEWESEIQKELSDSQYLLVFINVTYFESSWCLKELNHFLNPGRGEGLKQNRIIPIQLYPIDSEDILDSSGKQVYEKVQGFQIYDLSEQVGTHDFTAKSNMFCKEIIREIKQHIASSKKKAKVKNILVNDKCNLLDFSESNYKDIFKTIGSQPNKHSTPVCVIYTGGTIGLILDKDESKKDKNDLKQGKVAEIVEYFYKLKQLKVDIHFFEVTPIDSSNATFKEWTNLAKIISKLYNHYQGFVILHGANTMAYAASFLSFTFENLNKPIILTGAEIPLVEMESDAEMNVLRSVKIAAHESKEAAASLIPEVCIFYGESLFRGNRTTKYHAFNPTQGFNSLNSPVLGTFSNNRLNIKNESQVATFLRHKSTRVSKNLSYQILSNEQLETNIIILDIYPDMPIGDYVKMIENSSRIDAIILRTYGTGNPPDEPPLLLHLIKNLIQKGAIILNTTQSPVGRVLIKLYEKNEALLDLGVINGGDLTREAAYCKLKWLLGVDPNKNNVKKRLQKNLRGELKFSSYVFKFTSDMWENDNLNYYVSHPENIDEELKREYIDHVIIRINQIEIQDNISTDETYKLKFLYNPTNFSLEELQKEGVNKHLLEEYERIIGPGDSEFDKNLEATFNFRNLFDSNQSILKLGVLFDPPLRFKFNTIGIYIYTKSE